MLSIKLERYLFFVVIILFILLIIAYQLFPLKYEKEINYTASEMKMDPFLIAAVIKLESNYEPLALSSSGAFGLMQLMPETANWLHSLYTIQGTWRDPKNNIILGSFYLKRLLSDFENDLQHSLNAYHMGPTKLRRFLNEEPSFKETTYTKKISLYRNVYKILYSGFLVSPGE